MRYLRTVERALFGGALLLLAGTLGTAYGQGLIYVPNQGSANVSGYTIGSGGVLAATAGSPYALGTGGNPGRTAVSSGYLYTSNGNGTISTFKINANGTLTALA